MSKSIPLKGGMNLIVDDSDFEYVNQFRWILCKFGTTKSALTVSKGEHIYIHRMLTDYPKNLVVDHKNGNGLDNRRCNLRVCSHKENTRNRKIQSNNTTGYKGVSKYGDEKYQSKIRVNGKLLHLGIFTNVIDAANAYDDAANYYFGEFAKLNFPILQ